MHYHHSNNCVSLRRLHPCRQQYQMLLTKFLPEHKLILLDHVVRGHREFLQIQLFLEHFQSRNPMVGPLLKVPLKWKFPWRLQHQPWIDLVLRLVPSLA